MILFFINTLAGGLAVNAVPPVAGGYVPGARLSAAVAVARYL